MQLEHSHGGTPTFIAYAQGCRQHDCLAAFNDYKLRLAQRKLNGEFNDLRLRQNRLDAAAQHFAEQHRPVAVEVPELSPEPVAAEPEVPAEATADPRPVPAASGESGDAVEELDNAVILQATMDAALAVLKILKLFSHPISRTVNEAAFSVGLLSQMTGIPVDKCAALMDMLTAIGAVERTTDNRLVLTGIEPELVRA